MSVVVRRVMGAAKVSGPDGMRVTVIRAVAPPARNVQTLRPPLLGDGGGLFAPTVRPGAVRVSAPLLSSEAGLYSPTVRAGPVQLRAPLLQSTSGLYAPSIALAGAWYDAAELAPWQFVHDANGQRSAIWTGEPKVGNRWPKREATVEEVLAITAPEGRGYLPVPFGDYWFDTPQNYPRYDHYRGLSQLVAEPLPRFNRLFPSGDFSSPLTLPMLAYPYVVGMRGTGTLRFEGDGVGSSGVWELQGDGPYTGRRVVPRA